MQKRECQCNWLTEELLRKTYHYDDWVTRSQLPLDEKEALERFILDSNDHIRNYFAVIMRPDGHLESVTKDAILLKGRKT